VLRSLGGSGSGGRWCGVKRLLVSLSSLTVYMENDVTGTTARSIRHFAQHGERASSVIIHDTPRPVCSEIGDEHCNTGGQSTLLM